MSLQGSDKCKLFVFKSFLIDNGDPRQHLGVSNDLCSSPLQQQTCGTEGTAHLIFLLGCFLSLKRSEWRYCCRPRGQRSSSGRAPVGGRAGGRPAAPPQPAGEARRGHAQPSSQSEEQHAGGAEHHQAGQPGGIILVQVFIICSVFHLLSLRTRVILVWVGLFCTGVFPCITTTRPHGGSNRQIIEPSTLVSLTDSGSVDASG